ncbi:MAG: hypothetical protein CMK06_09735 [Ponticaulis sp.]|mgnify:CR=1 FL=1|nr:hypothetical protein [Ponticaulis sp.]MAT35403.1 hypothetical protein [Ponticaulis sp.]|tara:strand:- start:44295 stop:44819 length:525 start_codon:yes stop_codon:yes gene_type:complete
MRFSGEIVKTLSLFSLFTVFVSASSSAAEEQIPMTEYCNSGFCAEFPADWVKEAYSFKDFRIYQFMQPEEGASGEREALGVYIGETIKIPEFDPETVFTCSRDGLAVTFGRSAGTQISGPLSHVLVEKRGEDTPHIIHAFSAVVDLADATSLSDEHIGLQFENVPVSELCSTTP